MLNRPEPACLVIADISGYTVYLAGTELDHAQDILADLMTTVVTSLRPTFRLAKLEGDAAFVYVVTDAIDGSQLQDVIERCYFTFQRRLRDIRQASTCECNACIRIPDLDLKVLGHHGLIGRQRIAGREELVGSDVVVVHRLLKNQVEDEIDGHAYAMYTEACVAAMGLADPTTIGLRRHVETFEGIGEVTGWVRDLADAWQTEQDRAREIVSVENAFMTYEYTLPGPPEVAWDWLTSPVRRPQWQLGVLKIDEESATGRRGVGTTNHCIHGKDAIVEEIIDWRPVDYLTFRIQMPIPGVPKLTLTQALEATPEGTRVTALIARPRTARDLAIVRSHESAFADRIAAGAAALVPLIAAEMAARMSGAASAPEPDVPVSAGRNVAEPLTAGNLAVT